MSGGRGRPRVGVRAWTCACRWLGHRADSGAGWMWWLMTLTAHQMQTDHSLTHPAPVPQPRPVPLDPRSRTQAQPPASRLAAASLGSFALDTHN